MYGVTLGPALGIVAPRKYIPTIGPNVVPNTLNTIWTNVPPICWIAKAAAILRAPYRSTAISGYIMLHKHIYPCI